jgi:hypothetical protein
MRNPRQGEHNDIFWYTTEELCNVTTQYATISETAKLCLNPGSREATPSSGKEVPSDIADHSAKGGKKRRKQCPQGSTTTADYVNGNNSKAEGSDVGRIMIAAHGDKRQARLPTDQFKRLLEALTPGTELNEDPDWSDTMPFPREDTIMMVYDGHPLPPGRRRVSKRSPGAPTCCSWGRGDTGV